MMAMASTLSALVVQTFVIMIALETVKAYVPLVPTSHDVEYDNDVDVQPYHHPSDVDIFYRYLNSLLLDNLNRLDRRMSGDYDGSVSVKSSKRVPIDEEVRNVLEKRKVFWQPLGYLPAGIHPNGNQGSPAGGSGNGRGGQIFRYGK